MSEAQDDDLALKIGPMPSIDSPITSWAKYYRSLGWNSIPIKTMDKIPLIEWKAYEKKMASEEEVENWFSKWPNADIGVVCGDISGIAVMDIDIDKGGLDSLNSIKPKDYNLLTPLVKTGREGGGYHYYFKTNGKHVQKITDLRPGIDIQGEGSYAKAPPSIHKTGKHYRWIKSPTDFPLAEIPDWLLSAIEAKGNKPNFRANDTEHKDRKKEGVIKSGRRNMELTSLSGELYNRGYDPKKINECLHAVNKTLTEEPLPEAEVDRIKTDWPTRHFLENDVGNSERMVYYFGNMFRYSPPEDIFYVWDGRRWAMDDMSMIWELAVETIKNIAKVETEKAKSEDELKKLLELAKNSFSNNKLKGMINCLKSQPEIKVSPDRFDKNLYLLCCENGTLDLLNMEFREHRREDYITMIANVTYDPAAKSDLWDSFISTILPDADVRLFVQKICGLSLNAAIIEQRYYCCYGKRDNGKSRFTEAITRVLGDYAQVAPFTTFEKKKLQSGQARSDIIRMKNKRLVVIHEVPEDANRVDDNLIKSITGGDVIASRDLYQKEEEYTPTCKLIFEGNHKLKYSGHEPNFIKRTVFVHFDVTIPEDKQDKELPYKLSDPNVKSAILNWMYEGWIEYKKDIELNKKLTIPPKVRAITTEANLENDPVGFFLEKCCYVEKGSKVKSFELYTVYENFSQLEGITTFKIQKFGRIMKDKGYDKERTMEGVLYMDIGIKREWMSNEEYVEFNPPEEAIIEDT